MSSDSEKIIKFLNSLKSPVELPSDLRKLVDDMYLITLRQKKANDSMFTPDANYMNKQLLSAIKKFNEGKFGTRKKNRMSITGKLILCNL